MLTISLGDVPLDKVTNNQLPAKSVNSVHTIQNKLN
jgi:hypothetical protein